MKPFSMIINDLERLSFDLEVIKNQMYELTQDEQLLEIFHELIADYELNYLGIQK